MGKTSRSSSSVVPISITDGSREFPLGGKTYRIVFDLQAIGMIMAATKHNILTDGFGVEWLLNPNNLIATLQSVMKRYHPSDTPTKDELCKVITPANLYYVITVLQDVYAPANPTNEELKAAGIDVDKRMALIDSLKGADKVPPSPPMLSSSESGPSEEATY